MISTERFLLKGNWVLKVLIDKYPVTKTDVSCAS